MRLNHLAIRVAKKEGKKEKVLTKAEKDAKKDAEEGIIRIDFDVTEDAQNATKYFKAANLSTGFYHVSNILKEIKNACDQLDIEEVDNQAAKNLKESLALVSKNVGNMVGRVSQIGQLIGTLEEEIKED